MLLALKNRIAHLALVAILVGAAVPNCSQSQAKDIVIGAASPSILVAAAMDPTRDDLLTLGPDGQSIQQARLEALYLLSQPNSCSAWFLSADPQAAERFRSLRFAIDPSGAGEIVKFAEWREERGYYQPYVARTGQNVGWGSTITFNANGAFFKKDARVRIVASSNDEGRLVSSQPLSIAQFSGASLQGRVLAMLHEYGHILNILPIDSGVPSAAAISVQNTRTVLRHCEAQIHSRKKPSRILASEPVILSASSLKTFESPAVKPKSLGENLP